MSEQGIVVMDLRDALNKHGDLIRKHLVKNTLKYDEDKFLALEASALNQGFSFTFQKISHSANRLD